jgi:hypothetical protein
MTATKGVTDMYLALRKMPGQVAGPHLTLHGILILVGVAVLFLIAYRISLRIHPNRRCRPCGGTGKVSGVIFTWACSYCRKCGGDGMVPRLGTLMVGGTGRG